jgi:hypothetical protein
MELSGKEIRFQALRLLSGKSLWKSVEKDSRLMEEVEAMAELIRARRLRRGQENFRQKPEPRRYIRSKEPKGKGCNYCWPEIKSSKCVNHGGRVDWAALRNISKLVETLGEDPEVLEGFSKYQRLTECGCEQCEYDLYYSPY